LIADFVNEQLNTDPEAFVEDCVKLVKAKKLVKQIDKIIPYSDEVTLYQMVRIQVRKYLSAKNNDFKSKTVEERLNSLIDQHIESKEPVDIYKIAGIEKPDISILDKEFLKDMQGKQEHEALHLKVTKKTTRRPDSSQFQTE
jgi:type I restriction enzyme R subunit